MLSGFETDASLKLSRRINDSPIPSTYDDPKEVSIQTLSWYAEKVYSSYAVIVHFLSTDHDGYKLHNAKNSFVAGLAYGFNKELLMLAHSPYSSPIDYREILKIHTTAVQCDQYSNEWLTNIERQYKDHARAIQGYSHELKAQKELLDITIGESMAEQESESLDEYFVTTAQYNEAINASQSIFIGRKGSGKTANLYKISHELRKDVRNHICIIKPIGYELDGILRMLKLTIPTSEKGFLIESFWKFLIYTELAKSINEELSSKPPHHLFDDPENELLNFVKENSTIIIPDFSIRLESLVYSLQDLNEEISAQAQRNKISEKIHNNVLNKLRTILGNVLETKKRVTILVDNLDKAWNRKSEYPILSDLLLGLLRTTNIIERDFKKSDHWRKPVNLSLIIFLRSDIFSQIIKHAREPDKIRFSRITWHDSELLKEY